MIICEIFSLFCQILISKERLKLFFTDNHYKTVYEPIRIGYSSFRVFEHSLMFFLTEEYFDSVRHYGAFVGGAECPLGL